MTVIVVPNVSEGRDVGFVNHLVDGVAARARVLDVHTDRAHNRSVITTTGGDLVDAMAELAARASRIDLTRHEGVHPRLGTLDVCPFVPYEHDMAAAVDSARAAAVAIHDRTGLPIYLYGEAATRAETRVLPSIRAGGLHRLIARAVEDLPPDIGGTVIDPRRGVVCVGARDVLIAFNVWLRCNEKIARAIASSVRETGGGLAGVRALALPLGGGIWQVSMNLVEPAATSIDDAFDWVAHRATHAGGHVVASEIVGLVPERFLPDPDRQAARLLRQPGRSLESRLRP